MRSNFSVWALVVLMSFLLKNGDAFTIVQHIYNFTENDVRLDCPFLEGPRIVWQEIDVGEIIAINGTIFSTNAKYNNFDVSSERNISSLTIHRAEMEDGGVYSCHNPTGRSLSFWLHLQNPPTLSISVNGKVVNTSIDVDENTEVIVECNSTGADPLVSVSLAVDDEPLTLDEQIMDNYTHTAYASSRLTVKRSHREIVCIDSEQKLPKYKKTIYLNVNYKDIPVFAIFAITIVILVVLIMECIFYKHKDISVFATFAIAIFILVGLIIGYIIYKNKDIPDLASCAIFLLILQLLRILDFIYTHKDISLPVFATFEILSVIYHVLITGYFIYKLKDVLNLTTFVITIVILVVLIEGCIIYKLKHILDLATFATTIVICVVPIILNFIYKLIDILDVATFASTIVILVVPILLNLIYKHKDIPVFAIFETLIVINVVLMIGNIIYKLKDITVLATFAITIVILVVLIIGNIIYNRTGKVAGPGEGSNEISVDIDGKMENHVRLRMSEELPLNPVNPEENVDDESNETIKEMDHEMLVEERNVISVDIHGKMENHVRPGMSEELPLNPVNPEENVDDESNETIEEMDHEMLVEGDDEDGEKAEEGDERMEDCEDGQINCQERE